MRFFVDLNGRVVASQLQGEAAIGVAKHLVRSMSWRREDAFVAIYPHHLTDEDPPPAVLWCKEDGIWRCSLQAESGLFPA